jgi:hypothetical protein
MTEASWQIERVLVDGEEPSLRLRLDTPGRALFVLMNPDEAADLAEALSSHARSARIEAQRMAGEQDAVVRSDRERRIVSVVHRVEGSEAPQPRRRLR